MDRRPGVSSFPNPRVLDESACACIAVLTAVEHGRIQLLWDKTQMLEKQMFKQLPFSPEDLYRQLAEMDISREIANYRKMCPQLSGGNG